MIMYGHKPTLISGVPNTASSAATIEVARAREPETAGERVALHARDDRLAERPHVAEQIGEEPAAFVRVRRTFVLGDAAEVGARAERPVARAREHDHSDRVVGARRGHRLPEPGHHAVRHRVAALGPVDRDPGDAVADVEENFFVHRAGS